MNQQLPVLSPLAVEHRYFLSMRLRVFSQATLHILGASNLSTVALVLLNMIGNHVCIDTLPPTMLSMDARMLSSSTKL